MAAVMALGASGGGGGGATTGPASGGGAAGTPGDPAKATRTVEVRAGDDLRFQPDAVAAKAGETITFNVTNGGKIEHEFTLGDAAAQAQHERDMKSGGQMNMAQPNSVDVPAGATKQLTWTFTTAGTTLYGCQSPATTPRG